MRINTNLTALNTFTQYTNNNAKIKSSVEKLSSGSAINNAADNAAGLAISEKMRAQIRGLDKASTNAQDAISLVQTAEGSLNETTEILQRMRELATQAASDTNEDKIDREALQDEFSQLQEELNDIAKNTTFNKKNLLDGSLSRTTKTLTDTRLANSGMTVDLGNAAAGTYNFSVTTKLESAAVAGKQPTSKEIVLGDSENYFSNSAYNSPILANNGNAIELGGNASYSSLLNGNYKLSAEYSDDGGITVKATGDNGQSFEAKISASELEALDTDTASARGITLRFNAEADDAFNVSLGLKDRIASTKNNFDTLASNISKISVSISGGVTAKDAQYGVYANLTGAESVKLEAGMSSVSFSNGVKVNFDTLTASSVDTKNEARIDTTGIVVTSPSNADVLASLGTSITIGAGDTAAFDMSAANGKIAAGNYTITDTGAGNLELRDGAGNIWTAAAMQTAGTTTQTRNYSFVNAADATKNFTAGLTLTDTGTDNSFANGQTIRFNIPLTGSAAYSMAATSNGTAVINSFSVTDDSIIANGAVTIASSIDGSDTVFTATDSTGKQFIARAATASFDAGSALDSLTHTLTFKSAQGEAGFSISMTTTNSDATGVTFGTGNKITLNVENAGHNYSTVFSGSATDMSASTASKFSVDESANAGLTFQVGANEGDEMTIFIDKMDANYLGVASSSVGTREAAAAAIGAVDRAINQVSSQRSYLGAIQNRLDHKIANLNTSAENLTSAESQIRDVDMAKEMTKFTNSNILAQAATAMLAQANSLPQGVLSLLG